MSEPSTSQASPTPAGDPVARLTREQVDDLGRELDALREEVLADLGPADAAYIRRVVRVARASAVVGRTLLMFGVDPVSFVVGTAALSLAKVLDNMEIGHNVLHGQYDWMNDPSLESRTYEWDIVCPSAQWRHYHNFEHHVFTNVLGKDRDVGYGLMRVSETQGWSPFHLLQPLVNLGLCLGFQWGVGMHDLVEEPAEPGPGLEARLAEKKALFAAKKWEFRRKAGRQVFKDYVFFPLLAAWNAPRVLLGNLLANLLRNVWSNVIIFCGHFPDGVRVFTEEEAASESRGQWYVRQMLGSANIEGGRLFHLLTGHLSHQIEHHLFPDLPARRYPAIAERVRGLCERYGLAYNTGSLARQYGSVLARNWRLAFPPRATELVVAVIADGAAGDTT
ncbi:MAG: fatty acid desaturase family protein, partial [Alphaproteobacteria bacterium]